MIKTLILFSLLAGPPKDSIGIENINGKIFVIHQVDEKETLFAISRRYRTTVDAIIEHNAAAEKGLEVGQILKVPYSPPPGRPPDATIHEVQAKETLYSLALQYQVSMEDIRQWNKLTGDALSIGQKLIIRKGKGSGKPVATESAPPDLKGRHTVAQQETMYSISRQYGVTVQQLREWNELQSSDLKIGQIINIADPARQGEPEVKNSERTLASKIQPTETEKPIETKAIEEPVKETVVQPHTIRISESIRNGSETVESGIAELIEGTEGNRKYLALHRTAPIGTILKIRNEMNNREVFVRVMGRLADTALTNKVLIRISKSAYDRLGAIDQRFRVEVTYYK